MNAKLTCALDEDRYIATELLCHILHILMLVTGIMQSKLQTIMERR